VPEPPRGGKSAVAELVVIALVMVAIVVFLALGGPSVVGQIWADLIGAP
jgi:hypothetical protein